MSIKLPAPKYYLIGHRGVGGLRPENTYCSFSCAAEMGLNWIEFDVVLTKDDQWVVMHDEKLDRTTNGRGFVRDYTTTQLQGLDAGLWFKPPFPDQHIPSLVGALELAQQLDLYCNVEIKSAEIDPHKYATIMAEFIKANPGLVNNRIINSSFNLPCLIELRAMLPDWPIGYLIDSFAADTIEIVQKHNFSSINCNVRKITPSDLQTALAANIPVWLYTVNDQTTANFWIDKGVTGLFTDRPDLLRA